MPLYGSLNVDAAMAQAPLMAGFNPDTWTLPGVDVVQVSYEVAEAPALTVTPPSCHPSIPPYATFSILRVPESPHGPFNLAMVRLIVRAGIRPRGLLLASFTNNASAAAALSSGWGYRVATAEVSFSRRYGHVGGSVVIDGAVALDVGLVDPEPVAGGDVELFDNLHLANVAGDNGASQAMVVQVDPAFSIISADRGQADLRSFEPERLGITGLEPVYRVVAVACVADMELTPPRFVMDPVVPAIQSTRRLTTA